MRIVIGRLFIAVSALASIGPNATTIAPDYRAQCELVLAKVDVHGMVERASRLQADWSQLRHILAARTFEALPENLLVRERPHLTNFVDAFKKLKAAARETRRAEASAHEAGQQYRSLVEPDDLERSRDQAGYWLSFRLVLLDARLAPGLGQAIEAERHARRLNLFAGESRPDRKTVSTLQDWVDYLEHLANYFGIAADRAEELLVDFEAKIDEIARAATAVESRIHPR